MNVNEFKNIFKQLRKESGLTQKEISNKLGVSISTVAMWETGQRLPSPELYEQIADFFNVDIDFLYARTDIRQKIRFDADGNPQHTLSPDQEELLSYYDALNEAGKAAARERIEEMTHNDKFTKDTGSSASHAG